MLFARFVKFVDGITRCNKPAVKFLLSTVMQDVRSITGSNLRSIQRYTGIQVRPGLTRASAIKKFRMFPVPSDQEWKVPLLLSVLAIQDEDADGQLPNAILQDISCG